LVLPPAVRDAYTLFGQRRDLTRVQDRLLGLDELCLDEGVLVFRVENQSVAEWGIRVCDPHLDDPPVLLRSFAQPGPAPWRPFLGRFSLACVEMVLSETMLGNDICDNRELDDTTLTALVRNFTRLSFPDYPLWPEPDGRPVRWFGDNRVLLRDDGGLWLWVHARTMEALDRVRALLPGDWILSEG